MVSLLQLAAALLQRAASCIFAASHSALKIDGPGYNPLLIASSPAAQPSGTLLESGMKMVQDEDMPLCKDELCSMAAIGLNESEYRAIKGTSGIVLGLHLDRLAHTRLKAICKKQSPQAHIQRYARMRLHKKTLKQASFFDENKHI
jgi:hypothetical protein